MTEPRQMTLDEARTIPARNTDPETSHAATPGRLRAGSQRARLLAGFRSYETGYGAPASDEDAAMLAEGLSLRSEYAKRASELREAGLIEQVYVDGRPLTVTGRSGHRRICSRITDAGRLALADLDQQPVPPARPTCPTCGAPR